MDEHDEELYAKFCEVMHPNDPDQRAALLVKLRDGSAGFTEQQMRDEIHNYKLRCEGDWSPMNDLSDRQYER